MRSFAQLAQLVEAVAALVLHPVSLDAQYFDRNKVRGDRFDFRILQAPHFDAYHYPAESLATATPRGWPSGGTRDSRRCWDTSSSAVRSSFTPITPTSSRRTSSVS